MSIVNMISQHEIDMFDTYRDLYMGDVNCTPIPGSDLLNKCWAPQKERYLYQLLGNQLIYKKDVTYQLGEDRILENIYKLFENPNSATSHFVNEFNAWRDENAAILKETNAEWLINFLFAPPVLAQNEYNGITFYVNCPNDKVVKVQNGCRPMRTLLRILNMWGGLPSQDLFREEISVVLTQRELRGTLCLSIHPLDYATMSDNAHDWSSCMSWNDWGCYRAGTVEMMNSEAVIVAYLSDGNMNMGGTNEWNSKMWRELFIVSKKGLFGVKGYPYQNSTLVKTVLTTLAELASKNLGWNYDDKVIAFNHADWFKYAHTEGEPEHSYCFKFRTNTMYNDFGTITHYGIIGSDWDGNVAEDGSAKPFIFNYSGPRQCMCCGALDDNYNDTADLICCDCNNVCYCDECGERLDSDEIYNVDGQILCQYCFDNQAGYDMLSDEYHLLTNMSTLYVLPRRFTAEELASLPKNFNNWVNRREMTRFEVYTPYVTEDSWHWFETKPIHFLDGNDWEDAYAIIPEDIINSDVYQNIKAYANLSQNADINNLPDPIIL